MIWLTVLIIQSFLTLTVGLIQCLRYASRFESELPVEIFPNGRTFLTMFGACLLAGFFWPITFQFWAGNDKDQKESSIDTFTKP